ncbi:hypothetical protein EDC18_103299 [Natranaerovirga pectinivora]|uniref:DUF5673 domain-containing protein n=1 Tax=Natranaerovirga pectinivora TaxID=682400 RepID=A0A4R3MQZ3_9FIRM|nr:hypothetical protein [Natranaerovirga pectinivora]TCT15591.1 hypothetical protein EDC18_103299 [Natranaerovirga pectinivora]
MDIFFTIFNIILLAIIISTLLSKKVSVQNVVFETKTTLMYKLMVVLGVLAIITLIVFGIRIIQGTEQFGSYYITLVAIVLLQCLTYPRKIVANEEGFYYMTTFGGSRPIGTFKEVTDYNISIKGRLSFSIKNAQEKVSQVWVIGKLNEDEIKAVKKLMKEKIKTNKK